MKVTYIDHMGSDLSVVNAARISFNKKADWAWADEGKALRYSDVGLIRFLARGCSTGDWRSIVGDVIDQSNGAAKHDCCHDELQDILKHIQRMPPHWSPFAHTAVTLHLKMPIFVARQVMKHTTGLVYNEISRRYVDEPPEFYIPDEIRESSEDAKQGSGGVHESSESWRWRFGEVSKEAKYWYKAALNAGVAPEQARMILPQSMYTEVMATGNLYAWSTMYNQRTDPHAQKETRDLVRQVSPILGSLFPESWQALTQ